VEGDLTVKGITQRVTARGGITEATPDAFGGTRVGLLLETVVDRTKFDLLWNAPLPKGGVALANDVTLTVELELVHE
jgi:polyisoprenoid-binding protein YceI